MTVTDGIKIGFATIAGAAVGSIMAKNGVCSTQNTGTPDLVFGLGIAAVTGILVEETRAALSKGEVTQLTIGSSFVAGLTYAVATGFFKSSVMVKE